MDQAGTVKCRRCRRPLQTPASRAMGIGPRCAAIETATAGLNTEQTGKVLEAIADGAVVRTSRPGIAQVVSDDGSAVYIASVNGNCTCDWGVRRTSANVKTCWHPAAVRLDMTPRRRPARTQFILAA